MALSISSCRMTRPRPAPSAVRTAISRSRDLARASIRLVTFTQEISRTKATAAPSAHNAGLHASGQQILQRAHGELEPAV